MQNERKCRKWQYTEMFICYFGRMKRTDGATRIISVPSVVKLYKMLMRCMGAGESYCRISQQVRGG